jgi:hypothetical protein
VNYQISSYCIVKPGSGLPANGFTFDQAGLPSIFSNTSAVNSVVASDPGQVGTRGLFRGVKLWNNDLAVSKTFRLLKEGHRLQLRAEAYNALNHPNFGNPSLNMASSTTFGEITGIANGTSARVMQFALRYEF